MQKGTPISDTLAKIETENKRQKEQNQKVKSSTEGKDPTTEGQDSGLIFDRKRFNRHLPSITLPESSRIDLRNKVKDRLNKISERIKKSKKEEVDNLRKSIYGNKKQ